MTKQQATALSLNVGNSNAFANTTKRETHFFANFCDLLCRGVVGSYYDCDCLDLCSTIVFCAFSNFFSVCVLERCCKFVHGMNFLKICIFFSFVTEISYLMGHIYFHRFDFTQLVCVNVFLSIFGVNSYACVLLYGMKHGMGIYNN